MRFVEADAGGIIAIFFGFWAVLDLELGMLARSYLVGFQALLAGFTLLALAYRLRERKVEGATDNTANLDAKASPEAHHG